MTSDVRWSARARRGIVTGRTRLDHAEIFPVSRSRKLALSAALTASLFALPAGAQSAAEVDAPGETGSQLELSAVGLFGPSGAFDPGARLGFELRPFDRWGFAANALAVTGSRSTPFGDLSTRRVAGDLAATYRHVAGEIVSTAALGARAGWVFYDGSGSTGRSATLFYSQVLARGRGEWSFSSSWFLLFQMELAFAIQPAEARAGGLVVDDVAGLEADLSLGAGYRF